MLCLPVLCMILAGAGEFSPPNLVRNPGFEDVRDGVPADWSGERDVYSTAESVVHSGRRALHYSNADPGRYVLCTQTIPLEPGKRYELRFWAKSQDLVGDDSGATVCLEWSDASGKWVGGYYPGGVKGTTDWTLKVGQTPRIPPEAARCTVSCYVRQKMTGEAWWDDIEVRQYRGPIMSAVLLRPNYRGLLAATERSAAVRVALNLADYAIEPDQVAIGAELWDPRGRVIRKSGHTPAGAECLVELPTRGLQPGAYTARVTAAIRGAESTRVEERFSFRIVPAADLGKRTCRIDDHSRLLVNGQPFFPLGMYFSGIEEADLRTYADSAFNCLMPYGGATREQMDLAQQLGLKVIYTVKDAYFGTEWCPPEIKRAEDERPYIEARVRQFRGHPALLAWYLNDELPLEYLDRLEAHQQWLEELDPDHPTWVVLYQVDQVAQYARTYDVIGTDPYPIPDRPARTAGQWARMTKASLGYARPAWMVPQAFNWACYRPTDVDKLRPPTYDELRSMAWQCIAEGANGLVFYSFFDIKRDPAMPFDEHWARLKRLSAEIKEMTPILLSVEGTPAIKAQAADWLHWTVRQQGNTTYLIVVNDEDAQHVARFTLPDVPKEIRARGEAGTRLGIGGTDLPVAIAPFGVQILEIIF
ncbi:MAG TPA: carbohydrate binding domain-containing protein [Armatimonadota bacterium]|nr:carbohydrate binding domain-containing protein [Armatimonadota bacterium]